MKHAKIILTVLVLFVATGFASAQTKIAHINSAELMQDYPKVKSIDTLLQQYRNAYAKRIQRLENEILKYQQQLKDSAQFLPQPDVEVLTELTQEKYEEWQRLQQEYQNKMLEKQEEYLKPVIEELKKIITDVAKELGYDYVLDSTEGGNMIYGNPSYDLMEAVKKRIAEIAAKEAQSKNTGN